MPIQTRCERRYLGVCYTKRIIIRWPYPCRIVESIEGWLYEFAWYERVSYGIIARLRGCENNVMYQVGWFPVFSLGTRFLPGSRRCEPRQLPRVSACTSFPPPPIH